MYYTHNLRSQLQEWRNRVYKANQSTIQTEFQFFWNKMHSQPIVLGILQEALAQHRLSPEKRSSTFAEMRGDGNWFEFQTPTHQTGILYQMHLEAIEQNQISSLVFDFYTSNHDTFDSCRDTFVEMMIQPIINYINDLLDEGNSNLYLLEKYKRRVEWFTHADLRKRFDEYKGKKEDVFDGDLRLYLFDQGIDYPFSRPRSSSGEPDIVGMIDTENPLVLEVKYYDGINYKKNRIIDGFAQIVKYAGDYNKNIGYLVVFNLTQIEISIDSEDNIKQFPPRVHLNNKDYFIVVINLNFDKSASTIGKLGVETIHKSELIKSLNMGQG
jgi:hypothetical protein